MINNIEEPCKLISFNQTKTKLCDETTNNICKITSPNETTKNTISLIDCVNQDSSSDKKSKLKSEQETKGRVYATQNDLLMSKLNRFYNKGDNLEKMFNCITSEFRVSLRIIDWFATNYAKKYYTVYNITEDNGTVRRFKVYTDYKLKLCSYRKIRFDPFCRWERITFPYKDNFVINTTIGQMNFFQWVLENKVLEYILENYAAIECDMIKRNSTSKKKEACSKSDPNTKTRKKREELSVSAIRGVKKEIVDVRINFNFNQTTDQT
jgi:hypothetical protein